MVLICLGLGCITSLATFILAFSGICLDNSSGVLRKFIIYIVIGLSLFTLSITFV